MEKMVMLRSIYRAASVRSSRFAAVAEKQLRRQYHHAASRFPFHGSSFASVTAPPSRIISGAELVYHGVKHTDCRSALTMSVGSIRSFSEDMAHMPVIKDAEIQNAFKDLMAASWDELPNPVVHDATKALSKDTNDKTGQEILSNVLQAAEAIEEFGGILTSLKMDLDDAVGASGENVKPLPEEYSNALRTIFQRYTAYLDAFGPDEAYLRKKVENELGAKMIYLKMRCSGLGAEWGKITVLGTSGLSGSYVEQRA